MSVGIGAGGFLGVAIETVSGTYVAPDKFIPIQNESIKYQQETNWRRPIRQSADYVGAVDGNVHVEGDISMEAFEDVVAIMLTAARTTRDDDAAATPNFVYTFKGTDDAVPTNTLSITVSRNKEIFTYTGCVLSSFTFSVDDGTLMFNPSILGRDEKTGSTPTPTWDDDLPFGAGKYDLQIPSGTPITDADSFEFSVDDGAEAQFRLKNTGRGAEFIAYGEREVTLSIERDFENRTDYDAYKALTAKSVTMAADKGPNNGIALTIPAAIVDTYELGLSGQGDLIRASASYNGVLDANGDAYTIIVKTQLDLT